MAETPVGELPVLAAYRLVGLSARDIWIRYLALGGNADELSVDAQLHGVLELPGGEYNVLAHSLNEELDELPESGRVGRVAHRHSSVR
jgi:hypothetical protein